MSETEVLLEQLSGKKLDQDQNVKLAEKSQLWSFDSLEHIAHSPQNMANMNSTFQANNDSVDNVVAQHSQMQDNSISPVFSGLLQSQISNSFEISDLLGVLKTQDKPQPQKLEQSEVQCTRQKQIQQQQGSQENIDIVSVKTRPSAHKSFQQQQNNNEKGAINDKQLQVSDLLFALQKPEVEVGKKAQTTSTLVIGSSGGKCDTLIKEKSTNSPLQQRFVSNSVQSRRKTWGDISAEQRPKDRNKYYIIGDTSHLQQDGAFPSLQGSNEAEVKAKLENSPSHSAGAWSVQSIVKTTYSKDQKGQPPVQNPGNKDSSQQGGVANIVQKLQQKYQFIPKNIIRCVLESVQFDVGIAQQIFREMELEKDIIQENSPSDLENNTPTPTPTRTPHPARATHEPPLQNHEDIYRIYRKDAFQLSKESKQLRRRALRAFWNGSQVEGEGLIRSASEKYVLAQKEHEKAAQQIFSVVNIGFQDMPWKMDLHGLFPEEAAAVVVQRLDMLQQFSIYDRSKQPLEIITGRGRHTSDGESILLIGIDNLLKGYPYQHVIKGGSIFLWMGKKRTIIDS